MKRKLFFYGLILIITVAIFVVKTDTNKKDEFYTIVVLPDSEEYSNNPNLTYIFQEQINWILKNKKNLNIQAVIHTGDVVQIEEDSTKAEIQWQRGTRIIKQLDNEVPYTIVPGNNDYSAGSWDLFNKYFKKEEWIRERYPEDTVLNTFVETPKINILTLGYDVDLKDIDWAENILSINKEKKFIIGTHDCIDDNKKISPEGKFLKYHLVDKNENILLVLCSDALLDFYSVMKNNVSYITTDYQYKKNGGNAYLTYYKFFPNKNKIKVYSYSPHTKKRELKLIIDSNLNSSGQEKPLINEYSFGEEFKIEEITYAFLDKYYDDGLVIEFVVKSSKKTILPENILLISNNGSIYRKEIEVGINRQDYFLYDYGYLNPENPQRLKLLYNISKNFEGYLELYDKEGFERVKVRL